MWGNKTYNIVIKKGIIIILLLLSHVNLFSQDREYLIKAAFIEKITRFIDWPEKTEKQEDIIVIGILSKTPEIVNTFQFYFKDQLIHNKSVKIEKIENINTNKNLDLLFVSSDYKGDIEKIAENLSGTKVLIITEKKGYSRQGAHINLVEEYNRIRFEINPEKLNNSGFYVSSKLYAYGEVVK